MASANYPYGSEHYPLIIDLNKTVQNQTIYTQRYKYYKADWDKYRETISHCLVDLNKNIEMQLLDNNADIDNIISKFNPFVQRPLSRGKSDYFILYYNCWGFN